MKLKQFFIKYWHLSAGIMGIVSGVMVSYVFFSKNSSIFLPGALFGIISAGYFFYGSPAEAGCVEIDNLGARIFCQLCACVLLAT